MTFFSETRTFLYVFQNARGPAESAALFASDADT